jgi:hypothetical protein
LNYYAPGNYKNPPNTFGHNFEDFDKERFLKHYRPEWIFQNKAFRELAVVLDIHPLVFTKEFAVVLPAGTKPESLNDTFDMCQKIPGFQDYKYRPRHYLSESTVLEQFPKDVVLLRQAWIERIKKDPIVYLEVKFSRWLSLLLDKPERTSLWVTCGLTNGITVFILTVFITILVFFSNMSESVKVPILALSLSALLTALPLLIFLPDNQVRYLYWFYVSSFTAIVLFCANSEFIRSLLKQIEEHWTKRLRRMSDEQKSEPPL